MLEPYNRTRDFLRSGLWRIDRSGLGLAARLGLNSLRMTVVLWQDLTGGQLTMRAMSLVYTTLLSLVPLLAVSFSVLKGFGVHNQLEPLLQNLLAPLGQMGAEATQRIVGFVENVRVGVLGVAGLAVLLYTVISLIQKIEEAFNYVWHVQRPRSFSRRFSDYLSVIVVGPLLVFSALGMVASLMNAEIVQRLIAIEPFGTVMAVASLVTPSLLIIAAFTFVYVFVPNTTVHMRSAFLGALVAGLLWQATGIFFASTVASSARYAAIYTGFAAVIVFIIWLYLSWLILLFGAQIAYYHQNPEQVRPENDHFRLSNRLKERLALAVMTLVADTFHRGAAPWTVEALVRRLGVPGDAVLDLVVHLEKLGFLCETADDPVAFVPGRDLETIRVIDILSAVRRAEEEAHLVDESRLEFAQLRPVLARTEAAVEEAIGTVTLRELVSGGHTPDQDELL